MAPTIEELDATVRAFYESRGDTVGVSWAHARTQSCEEYLLTRCPCSKSMPKLPSTKYVLPMRRWALHNHLRR